MTRPATDSETSGAALFLTPEAPYPLVGGGALRGASLLEHLARRYTVDAIVFREPRAEDPRARLPAGLTRELCVIDLPHHRRGPAARALRNAARVVRGVPPLVDRFAGFGPAIARFVKGRRYEVAVVEHFWCAPYWEQVAGCARRTVLDLHNIESALHEGYARSAPAAAALGHRCFAAAARALERRWLPRYSRLLAASDEDAARVRAIAPGAAVEVYRNALPAMAAPTRSEEEVVAFSGNLEYHPNVAAVAFFAREIWPGLRERHAGLVWRLVGRNEDAARRSLAGDARIECTGPVEDAVAELARAKVAVVPLLAGSGTRLKILEAWAAATPVVSTRLGAEGLGARDGEDILLADGAAEFGAAVERLLGDAALRTRIGRAGRMTYELRFTWEAAWAGLEL